MPFKPITVRRWEAVVILFAVTAAFAIGLVALTRQTNQAEKEARDAKALAGSLKIQDDRIRAQRDEQIRSLHDVDVRNCKSVHRLDKVVRDVVGRSIKQIETQGTIPDLTPRQERRIAELNATTLKNLRRGLVEAKMADCHGVPPIRAVASRP